MKIGKIKLKRINNSNRKRSVCRKILTMTVIGLFSIAILVTVLTVVNRIKVVNESTKTEMELLWWKKASEINQFVARYKESIESTANMISNTKKDEFSKNNLNQFIDGSKMYVILEDKSFYTLDEFVPPPDVDMRQRPYYLEAKDKNEVVFSEPYEDLKKHKKLITVSRSIKTRDGVKGVLNIDMDITSLLNMDIGNNVFSDIKTKNGNVLIDTKEDGYIKPIEYSNTIEGIGLTMTFYKDKKYINKMIILNSLSTPIYSAIVIFLMVLVMGSIYKRNIKKPLDILINAFSLNSEGRLELKSINIDQNDEFGILSKLITEFNSKFNDILSLSTNNIGDINKDSLILKNYFSDIDNAFNNITTAIDGLNRGVNHQAESLTNGAQLLSDLNQVIETQTNLETQLTDKSKILNESVKIANNASKRLDELTTLLAEKSVDVTNLVQTTRNASNEIKDAGELIEDISSKTNLLALNAAIEAARAGEAGRGFAVVADEIRKLSQQTEKTTSIIRDKVNSLIKDAEETSNTMNNVGGFMEEQVNMVKSTIENINSIDKASNESNEIINEIAKLIIDIQDMSNKSSDLFSTLAAISQENAASSQEITETVVNQKDQLDIANIKLIDINNNCDKLINELKIFK